MRLEQIERKLKRAPALQKEYRDVLPASVQTKWSKWLQDVEELEQVAVPRCYFSSLPDSKEKEIHAFCDASHNAYGGVIYIRAVTSAGTAHALLVMAKTRVAPLKTMTIALGYAVTWSKCSSAEFKELFAGQTAQLLFTGFEALLVSRRST